MKKLKSLLPALLLLIGLCIGLVALVRQANDVVAASTAYKDYRYFDVNTFSGTSTYYDWHYRYSSKKLYLIADYRFQTGSGWNYIRYKEGFEWK